MFTAAASLAQVVLPGGDSAAGLASATLLKLLTLSTPPSLGLRPKDHPLPVGVLAYLREVLRRDFLDFIRSKRATTSVYPDDERADGQDLSDFTIDQRVASYGNPEDEHLKSERLVWLVEQFEDDPPSTEEVRVD